MEGLYRRSGSRLADTYDTAGRFSSASWGAATSVSTGMGDCFHLVSEIVQVWEGGEVRGGVTKAQRTNFSMDHVPYDRQASHFLRYSSLT